MDVKGSFWDLNHKQLKKKEKTFNDVVRIRQDEKKWGIQEFKSWNEGLKNKA